MRVRRLLLLLSLGLGAVPACDAKINPGGSCPQPTAPVTYTAQVQPFLRHYCIGCHSAKATNREGAPSGVNFDTYEEAQSLGEMA
ncbi:MAG TPA: hypothetical protein VFH51_19185, partial [Myxococcota bacterium]|nr:hypothetical protein [Myxococcota bacterium]